jgi:hypothetical protein
VSGDRDLRGIRSFRAYRLPIAIHLLLVIACQPSPQKQREQIQQQLSSWDATERLTSELAGRGALPSVYVRQVREVVEQGRRKAQQQAAKISQ